MREQLREDYLVLLMCRIHHVSQSGYYAWQGPPPPKHAHENARLKLEIRAAHQRSCEIYCLERLQEDLADNGFNITVYRVKRIRRKFDIRCKQNRKFRNTTDANRSFAVAPNLLGQKFTVAAPNHIWVTDITNIPTGEGWHYLAGHKDLFSGDLVGYATCERMTKILVFQSLFRSFAEKRPQRIDTSLYPWQPVLRSEVTTTARSIWNGGIHVTTG